MRSASDSGFSVPPFRSEQVRRVYYTYGVPVDAIRGGHAHKQLKQMLSCPNGKVRIILDDGSNKADVVLDCPEKFLFVGEMVWHDMVWESEDAVLLVTASDCYSEDDYIRDHGEFLGLLS